MRNIEWTASSCSCRFVEESTHDFREIFEQQQQRPRLLVAVVFRVVVETDVGAGQRQRDPLRPAGPGAADATADVVPLCGGVGRRRRLRRAQEPPAATGADRRRRRRRLRHRCRRRCRYHLCPHRLQKERRSEEPLTSIHTHTNTHAHTHTDCHTHTHTVPHIRLMPLCFWLSCFWLVGWFVGFFPFRVPFWLFFCFVFYKFHYGDSHFTAGPLAAPASLLSRRWRLARSWMPPRISTQRSGRQRIATRCIAIARRRKRRSIKKLYRNMRIKSPPFLSAPASASAAATQNLAII